MTEESKHLIDTIHRFQRLQFGTLVGGMPKRTFFTLQAIKTLNEKEAGVSVTHVTELMKCSMPGVSRTLKKLEEKGYIERGIDKKDRRNTYVTITQAGKDEVDKLENILQDFGDDIIEKMGKEDVEQLIDLLDKLYVITEEKITGYKLHEKSNNTNI